jgi:hypothetical protein
MNEVKDLGNFVEIQKHFVVVLSFVQLSLEAKEL